MRKIYLIESPHLPQRVVVDFKQAELPPTCSQTEYIATEDVTMRLQYLEAKMVHRHRVGNVYDISRNSIDSLVGELEDYKAEVRKLEDEVAELKKQLSEK